MLELPAKHIEQYAKAPPLPKSKPTSELVEKLVVESLKQESAIDWDYHRHAETPFKLIKTPFFGKIVDPKMGEYFEWPTEQEIKRLSQHCPLKLKEINANGKASHYMSAI